MSERERYTKKLCLSSLSVVVYWCSVDDVNDVLFFFSLSRCAVGAALFGARGGGRRASFSMCARELSRVPMRCVCKQSE